MSIGAVAVVSVTFLAVVHQFGQPGLSSSTIVIIVILLIFLFFFIDDDRYFFRV
jgi:hypothetical protein